LQGVNLFRMTDQLSTLAVEARRFQPRLFTLYGVFKSQDVEILGWGMDFPEHGRTLFFDPESRETHRSDTPDRLLESFECIADVRLEWLDAE
jgi:hypothetical protein